MPDVRFGRRVAANAKVESRYTRGGLSDTFHFIRGYTDGVVQVWDTRNPKVSGVSLSAFLDRAQLRVHL